MRGLKRAIPSSTSFLSPSPPSKRLYQASDLTLPHVAGHFDRDELSGTSTDADQSNSKKRVSIGKRLLSAHKGLDKGDVEDAVEACQSVQGGLAAASEKYMQRWNHEDCFGTLHTREGSSSF